MLELKIKKLRADATLPTYGSDGAACFDIYTSDETKFIPAGGKEIFHTGLSFEVPENHVMLVFSRSGHGFKNNCRLSNCVGVIDSDYRGELMVKIKSDADFPYEQGMVVESNTRIAQALIIPYPKVSFIEVDELSETVRGEKGLGSTGNK